MYLALRFLFCFERFLRNALRRPSPRETTATAAAGGADVEREEERAEVGGGGADARTKLGAG